MMYLAVDLLDQLAHVGQDVVRAGLVVGSGGNLSARTPDDPDLCWVTAAGTWLDRLSRRDFVLVRISDGTVVSDSPAAAASGVPPVCSTPDVSGCGTPDVSGAPAVSGAPVANGESTVPAPRSVPADAASTGPAATDSGPTDPASAREVAAPAPTTELELHLATYRARPDASAVVHLHPQTALLLDALGQRIRLVTTDHAFYLRRVVTVPFAPPGSVELARLAAEAVADGTNCAVLSHHGCSVLADSVELAHKRALYLEEAAVLTYRAIALGSPAIFALRDCPSAFLHSMVGSASLRI